MKARITLSLVLGFVLVLAILNSSFDFVFSEPVSNISSPFDFGNNSRSAKNGTSLPVSDLGKYDSTEINAIIYGLYDDYLKSDKKADHDHFHYVGILIDFICSNKIYEDTIEACDIVTEFPID